MAVLVDIRLILIGAIGISAFPMAGACGKVANDEDQTISF
jgi:Na+-transporting methylmalonyl-CoA/oxaloacetate decarboxylase beta subunit